MGAIGSKFCEKHPDQEMMFICVTEDPPKPICAKCRADGSHHKHEVRSTKNLAGELIEKLKSLPQRVKLQFKSAIDQPKSVKSYEQILGEGKLVINGIFDRIAKELEAARAESLGSFEAHMKNSFDSIPVKPINTALPGPLLKLLADIDEASKKVSELYAQEEFIEICTQKAAYKLMKDRLKQFLLTVQNDYTIRQKLETYQIFFEQGEFRNQFKKLVQHHVKFYYSGDQGNEEISPVKVNRLHALVSTGNGITLFDVHSRKWSSLALKGEETLPDMGMQSAETRDNKIFIVGGVRGVKYLSDVYQLNEDKCALVKMAPMSVERADLGLAVNGTTELYAIGGENNSSYLSHCEVYRIKDNKWAEIPKLNVPRKEMGCCVFNGAVIYVVGGTDDEYLNSIEQYTIGGTEKAWKPLKLAEMPQEFVARQDCGVVQITDTQMLIFGGYSDKKLADSYVFKPDAGRLTKTSEGLKKPEQFVRPSFEVVDKFLYCLQDNTVHMFELSLHRWSLLGST